MYNRVIPFLVDNNILTETQNGIRKNKSTKRARKFFMKNIQDALDRGLHAIGFFHFIQCDKSQYVTR